MGHLGSFGKMLLQFLLKDQLRLYDLDARATPKGWKALGYAMMLAFWNLSLAAPDMLGSYLYDNFHLPFKNLV